MPRRSFVVEDDDDGVPLRDLLRTGEASRLRRRGALRATAHRRDDDEDALLLPFPRKGDDSYLELECGVRSGECSFTPAGPSRPRPLPRSSYLKKTLDVGVVFSSTGCGAIVSTKALPSSIAARHVYTSTEPVSSDVAQLHYKYLDSEQLALAETLMKDVSMCQYDWEAIGCRICGNALGLLYAACHPRHGNTSTYVFFPSAVTPSPDFSFPPAQLPESDDMSVDSPTLSPRVTRYFRSDEEFWPSEMNPSLWTPDRGFTPTPPRSPPTVATQLAYTAWQGALTPPVLAAQTRNTAARTTADAPPRRELTHTVPVPAREPVNDWRSFFRSVSPHRTESPQPQNANDTHLEESPPQLLSEVGPTLSHEYRDRAALERPSVSRTDSRETGSRSLEPPSLHRVTRRPTAPAMRRPTALLDWSGRGRHISASDVNSSWAVQGSDERFSRRGPSRRITVAVPAPVPPPPPAPAPPSFTFPDASGERSYPPRAESSLDVRDTLGGVSMDVETEEEAAIAHMLMQEHENELPTERSWNHDLDGENEEVEGDDSEEKEDDLDERRAERTSRNDIARAESHFSNLRGLISR